MSQEPGTARMEDLLAHADWLRRLAAGLVGDGEDVVQDTWVAALRSPPRTDSSVQPWLATVMRNIARNRWRARRVRQRAAAELVPATEQTAAPSPQDLLERAQLQRILSELVLELEEPYRSTVLLRYYEGLDSADIATRLGLPAGTVRWRLKEGIDRLRRGMDARHGGDRRRWVLLLAPLAAPASRPGGGSGGGAAIPFATGGAAAAAMSTTGKIAVAALLAVLVLGGGAALWRLVGTSPGGSVPEVAAARVRALRPLSALETALPPAAIEGAVEDPAGQPISGAVVVLSRATRDWLTASLPAGLAVSDRDGRFRFEDARPGEHLVSASAPGFVATFSPTFALRARERKQVPLTLSPGGELLQGRVLDEGGGPIPGARVTARITLSGGGLGDGPARLVQTLADGEGRYRLALSPREYTVRAEADGYAPLETTAAVTRPLQQDLRLHPAALASGRVVARDTGQPLAGAEVRVDPVDPREGLGARATRTDDEGRFTFDDLSATQYRLNARQGTMLGEGPVLDLIAAARVDGVEVALDRGAAVAGRLIYAEPSEGSAPPAKLRAEASSAAPHAIGEGGRGVAGVAVTLAATTAISGADGSFRVEGVSPGRHRLRVATSREGWTGVDKELTVGPGGLNRVEVTLSRGGLLTGRVLKADGTPAPGAQLRADPDGGRGLLMPITAESGGDGTFRIAGLPDGTATVQAWDPVFGVARQEVGPFSGASQQQVDLRLGPAASISGRVTFDDGSPAAAVSVAFTGQGRGMPYTSVSTVDDGRFSVQGLLPGRYTVKARRKLGPWNLSTSFERPDLRIVTLEGEQRAEGVELVLPKGGRNIGGVALLADGQPAVGAQVVAGVEESGRAGRPPGHVVEHRGMVREDGRFLIEDVEAGLFTLWGLRPGLPEVEVNHVAAGRQDAQLQFTAPARLSGVVVDGSGRPLPSYSLNVVPGASPGETPEQRVRRTQLGVFGARSVRNPEGRFDWSGLRGGNHEIRIHAPTGAVATRTVALAAGEHKQGLRLVGERGVRVTGKAVDLDSGAPLDRLLVYARTAGRNVDTTTNAEGRFELSGMVPGEEVEVRVIANQKHVPESKRLQVPTGTATADLGLFRLMRGDFERSMQATGTFRLVLDTRGDQASVLIVRAGSNAARAGIQVGDRILSVDGRDVQGLGAGAIHHLLAREVGARVSLIVQPTSGAPRPLTLVAEPHARLTPPTPAQRPPRQN